MIPSRKPIPLCLCGDYPVAVWIRGAEQRHLCRIHDQAQSDRCRHLAGRSDLPTRTAIPLCQVEVHPGILCEGEPVSEWLFDSGSITVCAKHDAIFLDHESQMWTQQ